MSTGRKVKVAILNALMKICFIFILVLVVALIGYIAVRGLPNITWNFLSTKPSVLNDNVGILPNILNTLYIVLMTLVVALPLSVGAAIYLNEYAKPGKMVSIIEFAIETLSGIPSIIYGLAGMLIFVRTLGLQTGLLAGALTLAVMTLPTIIRNTQESLKTVPDSYREGSLALGSGKWHMIRTVVLPSSIDGIVTGCILAVGRIVGESAALLYTAGLANNILSLAQAVQPGNSGSTLSVALYVYAAERGDKETAFAIAAILLILTLCINLLAKLAAKKLKNSN